jgi:hypothetical protein
MVVMQEQPPRTVGEYDPHELFRCTKCDTPGLPIERMAPQRYRRKKSGESVLVFYWCKDCKRRGARDWDDRQDPKYRAKIAQERKDRERRNPELRERRLAKQRAVHAQRMKTDPAYRLRRIETNRMHRAIRAMREGREYVPRNGGRFEVDSEAGGLLDSKPLAEAVWPRVERRAIERGLSFDDYAEAIGVGARRLRAWRNGEAETVTLDVADRAMCAVGLLWFEVYCADRWPDAHEKARALFEGES